MDNQCHDYDLDCLGKAGREILGDGAKIIGNKDTHFTLTMILAPSDKYERDLIEQCCRGGRRIPRIRCSGSRICHKEGVGQEWTLVRLENISYNVYG